eukprot:3651255-Alexandrium_andersonii.AAC.1
MGSAPDAGSGPDRPRATVAPVAGGPEGHPAKPRRVGQGGRGQARRGRRPVALGPDPRQT